MTYITEGEMVTSGYAASTSTSTGAVGFRFRLENPEGCILPAMFVPGRIEADLVPRMTGTRATAACRPLSTGTARRRSRC